MQNLIYATSISKNRLRRLIIEARTDIQTTCEVTSLKQALLAQSIISDDTTRANLMYKIEQGKCSPVLVNAIYDVSYELAKLPINFSNVMSITKSKSVTSRYLPILLNINESLSKRADINSQFVQSRL